MNFPADATYLNPRGLWKSNKIAAFYAGFSIWNQKQPQETQMRTHQHHKLTVWTG
jgi:hypothetical protein